MNSKLNKTIFNTGYIGEGKYKKSINGIKTKTYITWVGMIQRCYSEVHQLKHITYINCGVCNEWKNFQTFAKWYEENYPNFEIENSRWELDKDLLVKENKIYSPNTCIFIPNYLNTFLANNRKNNSTGKTGVSFCKRNNKYRAYIRDVISKKKIHLGYFETIKEASKEYEKERKVQCVNIINKLINDGITNNDILKNVE